MDINGRTADDTIIFNMTSAGYMASTAGSFAGTTQIGTDETEGSGLILNQGYGTKTYTFSGALTGSGVIKRTGTSTPNIILAFTGDTTGFGGDISFAETSGGYTQIQFGNGQSIADAETAVAGTGTITFGGQSTSDKVIFNYGDGTVNIGNAITTANSKSSRIELQGSAHMKFSGDVHIGYLTIGGNVAGVTVTTGELGMLTEGSASVALTKTGSGNFFINNDANFSSVSAEAGTLILTGTGNTSTTKSFTSLGDVTVAKGATFRSNSTRDTIVLANTVTVMAGADGQQTAATITKKDGAESWQAANFIFSPDANNVCLKAVSGTAKITDADIAVPGSLVFQTVELKDSTVSIGGTDTARGALRTWDSSHTTTLNNTTVTIMGGENYATAQATFQTKSDSEAAMTFKSYQLTTVNDDNAAQINQSGGTSALITNAAIDVTGTLFLSKVTFTNSHVTVKDGAFLKQSSGANTVVTFDGLTIEEGGTLVAGTTNNYTFGGDTSLTLTSLMETSTADSFTTDALMGKLNASGVLTLNLSAGLLDANGDAYLGDTFSITFTNLLESTAGDITTSSFVFEDWDVTDVVATSSGTTFTLARPVAIPEPATATLSLLALAGLAARRRRK